jgi:tetratricopeptide (TPR) repeat protein/GGDEF domain-containing protein
MSDNARQLERARRNLEKNKLREAAAEYQAVYDASPTNQEAIQALGDLYVRLNEPARAQTFYGLQVDRLIEVRDAVKALALYSRFLRGVPQPPARHLAFAAMLQQQNRVGDAVEQLSAAAERYKQLGKEREALGCLEKIAQLDSEGTSSHLAVAELAIKLGNKDLAARSYLRAGQISQGMNEPELALEYFSQAHQLTPGQVTITMFLAEARLRHNDAAEAVNLLEPFAANSKDPIFLALFGEALLRTEQLDRAREAFEAFYLQKKEGFGKLFELAGAYFEIGQELKAVEVLEKTKSWMKAIRRENEFANHFDRLMGVYPESLQLAQMAAMLYEELNRETKYFDSLVHLFDLYLQRDLVHEACDALDRLVDIDPYDYRNQERISKLEGKADPAFLKSILSRAAKAATINIRAEGFGDPQIDRGAAPGGEMTAAQALDDLIVQVEIFLQYSLRAKAIERLEKIAQMFPGEEDTNDRLRAVYERANWWPLGKPTPSAPKPAAGPEPAERIVERAAAPPAPASSGFDENAQRDLERIGEITRQMFRQNSATDVATIVAQETGKHLEVSNCGVVLTSSLNAPAVCVQYAVDGAPALSEEKTLELAESCARQTFDHTGVCEMGGGKSALMKTARLSSVLCAKLTDKETHAVLGHLFVTSGRERKWRPNERFFVQAIGNQLSIAVAHVRAQTAARASAFTDERTGLVSRGAYVDCLLVESSRGRTHNTPVSLLILHVNHSDPVPPQGQAALDKYMEQLSRALRAAARPGDMAVKYTPWSVAFILPDTNLKAAQTLGEKLTKTAGTVHAPWQSNGSGSKCSVVVAEAAGRIFDDNEDCVTELINRAETAFEEVRQHEKSKVMALATP